MDGEQNQHSLMKAFLRWRFQTPFPQVKIKYKNLSLSLWWLSSLLDLSAAPLQSISKHLTFLYALTVGKFFFTTHGTSLSHATSCTAKSREMGWENICPKLNHVFKVSLTYFLLNLQRWLVRFMTYKINFVFYGKVSFSKFDLHSSFHTRNKTLFGLAMCPLKHHTWVSPEDSSGQGVSSRSQWVEIPESPLLSFPSQPLADILAGTPTESYTTEDKGLTGRMKTARRCLNLSRRGGRTTTPKRFPNRHLMWEKSNHV